MIRALISYDYLTKFLLSFCTNSFESDALDRHRALVAVTVTFTSSIYTLSLVNISGVDIKVMSVVRTLYICIFKDQAGDCVAGIRYYGYLQQ